MNAHVGRFGDDQAMAAGAGGPDDGAGTRVSKRDSMLLQATARQGTGAPAALRVRNLSTGGLMADALDGYAEGEVVVLALRGIGDVGGRVVWVKGGRMGIGFARAVDTALARKPQLKSPGAGMTLLKPAKAASRRPAIRS